MHWNRRRTRPKRHRHLSSAWQQRIRHRVDRRSEPKLRRRASRRPAMERRARGQQSAEVVLQKNARLANNERALSEVHRGGQDRRSATTI